MILLFHNGKRIDQGKQTRHKGDEKRSDERDQKEGKMKLDGKKGNKEASLNRKKSFIIGCK